MTHHRKVLRSHAAAVLLWGAIGLAGGASTSAALGQIGLPEAVISAPSGSLSASEKEIIQKFVDANKAGLASETGMERARKALASPLRSGPNSTIAAAFRIEYSTLLTPVIEPMAADKSSDRAAINGVVLAGELGTKEGLKVITTALKDTRAAVRAVAANGFRSSLATGRMGSTGQPAFAARDAIQAVKDLEAALVAEKDALVADAIAIALDEGTRTDADKFPGVRAAAVQSLAAAVGARARGADALALTAVFARASDTLQDAVREISPKLVLASPSLVEAAGLAGDLIAMGVRVDPASVSPEKKAEIAIILKQAENLYFFAYQKLNGKPTKVDLDKSWETDWAKYKKDALVVLSTLKREPFKFSDDRFPTK